eukprot:CAMPEP_0181364818 /NCGR_PEP_ID=MMETSP1106-20121128/9657_1 /TAXON_ID=81844 /ORGANISM="Mantoniella antarctica, Strain SL-175" /LENGTH=236 /DNA_ID=CAMNT_0023479693 /DNA_START=63 /DNA_END=769 /DNA_ORIENTATION=-
MSPPRNQVRQRSIFLHDGSPDVPTGPSTPHPPAHILDCIAVSSVAASSLVIMSPDVPSRITPSPSHRGTTWKCTWNTTWPAAAPLFCTTLTPSHPVASRTSRASRGSSLNTSAATSAGMSAMEAYPEALGTSSAWPRAMGNASRNASACSVSKILYEGMSPAMIFLKTLFSSYGIPESAMVSPVPSWASLEVPSFLLPAALMPLCSLARMAVQVSERRRGEAGVAIRCDESEEETA